MNDFNISGYQITHPSIARGRTGAVYKGQRHGDNTTLAVKHYQAMAVDLEHLERNFTKLTSMPSSDKIADLVDVQLETAPYYSIVEYLPGQSLAYRPMLKEDQAWDVIKKLVEALGHAHKYGVIHGNLHPSNIHFTEEGDQLDINVTDFGAGLCGQYHCVDTSDNAFFLAPEQLISQGREITVSKAKKWDVYSFGVIAYWLLTDHLPRGEDYLAKRTSLTLQDGAEVQSIDPTELGEQLKCETPRSWGRRLGNRERESQWRELIDQCLAIDPETRPVDIREVKNRFLEIESQHRLKKLESQVETTISDLEANYTAEKTAQRKKLVSARVATTVLALSCLGASYLVVMFVKNAIDSKSKIHTLDQVVETQQESLSKMDHSIAETSQFLRQSRAIADDSFYKLTQQSNNQATLTELEQSRQYYCRVLEEVKNSNTLGEERARSLHSLAHIENLLSKKNSAVVNFELAIDAFEQLLENSDDADSSVLVRLADCYEYVGLLSDASSTKEGFEATAKSIDYFRQAVYLRPTDKELAMRLATISFRYGRYLYASNQFNEAIRAYSDAALEIKKHRDNGDYQGDTSELDTIVASLQYHAAEALKEEGRNDEAVSSYIAAIESAERLRSMDGYGREISLLMCRSFTSLGDIFDQTDNINQKARDQVYNEALRLIAPAILESPKDVNTASLYCKILSRLSDLEHKAGNKKDGYQLSIRGIEKLLAALEKEPNNLPGFIQLAEARLNHLQFIAKDPKLARKIALRGVDTAKHAHNLVAKTEDQNDYQYRGRVYNQLRQIFDGYGDACKKLGQSKTATECFEYASHQFTAR